MTRKYGSTVLGSIGVALWLAALYLLAVSRAEFGRVRQWLPWILLINISGLLTLLVLLAGKLTQLVRDYRRHIPGSRLKGRTVAIFSALAVAPILVVYYFSLQFINRGIDSWFELEVSQGLKDTRELSHAALEVRVREFLQHTQLVAHTLSASSALELIGTLDRERRDSTALEFTIVGTQAQILATSSDRPMDTLPVPATDEMMLQLRRGRPYVSLDTDSVGGYVIRAAAPLDANGSGSARVLIALYPVPQQLSQLADTVQRSYTQYANLVQLRRPLKSTFVLILTFVVLMSLIAAVYGAFFAAQRLVQPVQDLIAGTRAVAKGNYDTKLPLPSRDELGFLVTSFNDMTKRLGRAREETRRSQQAVEAERAGLAVILARLSTGVVSLEPDLKVRTANQAASAILGVDLEAAVGKRFDESISDSDAVHAVSGGTQIAPGRRGSGLARADRVALGLRQARADVRLHRAAQRSRRRRRRGAGVRRHHHAAAGAARRRLGRSGAPPGARNQESADAHSAVRGAHAAQISRQHECAGCADPGAGDAHHRGPGRCDEADGQCIQRICAGARHAFLALRSEPADHRGGGSVPGAGQRAPTSNCS